MPLEHIARQDCSCLHRAPARPVKGIPIFAANGAVDFNTVKPCLTCETLGELVNQSGYFDSYGKVAFALLYGCSSTSPEIHRLKVPRADPGRQSEVHSLSAGNLGVLIPYYGKDGQTSRCLAGNRGS